MQDSSLKQRLVGAVVLVFLGVIVIPMLLGGEGPAPITQSNIPPPPKSEFSSKIIPLDEVPAAGTLNPVPISPPAASVEQHAAPAAAAPSPAKSAATAAAPVVQTPARNVTPTATPVVPPPAKSAAIPSVVPPVVTAKVAEAWAVRLGSFVSEQNALALRDKLRGKGYKALVEKVTTHGVPLLRVSVGPEAERARAEAVRDKLQQELKIKGNVVQYP